MAYADRGMTCIKTGPYKLFTYYTTDTMDIEAAQLAFTTDNQPNLAVGDIIIVCHDTNAAIAILGITKIAAAACSITQITALG